jgi:hypothetical protein
LATVLISCTLGFLFFVTAAYIYSSCDPWAREKARLEKFWREVFGIEIDLTCPLPEYSREFSRLEFVPEISLADLITRSREYGMEHLWSQTDWNLVRMIVENSAEMQSRPAGSYAFCHRGEVSADEKHKEKSYSAVCQEGFPFMNTREYVIHCIRRVYENRPVCDQASEGTVLADRITEPTTLWGFWTESGSIDFKRCHKDGVCRHSGPREIVLADSHLS